MEDKYKSKEMLINELQCLRQRLSEFPEQNTNKESYSDVVNALGKSEEKYRVLFDSMNDGLGQHQMVFDEDGNSINYRITDINPAYEKILGKSKSDVVGKLATEVYRVEQAPYLDLFASVAESGKATRFETYFQPIGRYFSVSVFSPAKSQFAVVFKDISERKHAENEIVSLSRFPAENPDPVYRVNRDGLLLYHNSAGYPLIKKMGVKEGELVIDDMVKLVKEVFSSGQYASREIKFKNQCLLLTVVPVIEANYANFYVQDITERKFAEQKLRESEERLQLALESAVADSWEIDVKKGSCTFSDRWAEYLGYSAGEIPQTVSAVQSQIHPDDLAKSIEMLEKHLSGEIDTYEVELRVRRKDGSYNWVLSRGKVVHWDSKNRPRKIIGTTIDINDRKLAEKERHRLQVLLSAVIQQSPVPIAVASASDNTIQACNHACSEVLGILDEPDVVGQSIDTMNISWQTLSLDGKIIERDKFPLMLALKGFSTAQSEVKIVRKDGSHRFCLLEGVPIFDRDQNLIAGFIVFPDITQSKQAEKALSDSETQFRSLVESTSDWIWRISSLAVYTYASPRVKDLLGYDPEEVVGKTPFDFIPEDERESIVSKFEEMAASAEPIIALEKVCKHKDGHLVVLETSGMPIIGENGELLGYQGIDRDITQRKISDDELRLKNHVFESSITANSAADNEGIITHVNVAFLNIWGYQDKSEVIGKSVDYFFKDNVEAEKIILALNETGEWRGEYLAVKKDGSVFDAFGLATTVKNEKGEKIGYQSAVLDISDRKRAEQEREKLHAQLQQSQKMESVGRLAGGVAHDFNNMLGVILGHAEMALAQLEDSHALHPDLVEIQKAAQRSAELTRQLLAFARKQTVTLKTVELNDTVHGMLSMLKRLIGEDINLIWEPGDDLWLVRIDPSQIDQILANLCVNSRDAIVGVGSVTIKSKNTVLDEAFCESRSGFIPGEYVELSVSDNGIGMEKQVLGYVFEPFFTTKQSGQGTGLGLATVYGIVKQNKGYIDVKSDVGVGTTFWIYLPRYKGKVAKGVSANIDVSESGKKGVVFLVEDEPAILELGQMMLKKMGYQVLAAGTPSEAIRIASQYAGNIDLLISDVIMPEMNGRELSARLLTLYPEMKRIFMSGYTADVIAHHGVLEEDTHFLQKPFSINDLRSKIKNVLGEKNAIQIEV